MKNENLKRYLSKGEQPMKSNQIEHNEQLNGVIMSD